MHMTKTEVMEMLDGMEEETLRNIGPIAGPVAEASVIDMIRRRRAEVDAKEGGWGGSSLDAGVKEAAAGGDGRHRPGWGSCCHGSGEEMEACPGKEPEGYGDLFLYVPAGKQVIRIAEGSGDSLHREDVEEGYVDYIYYEQHEVGAGMPVVDGGTVLLEELLREKYRSMAGCIPDVLDMAYGTSRLGYTIL